jgi:hypothetical protein
MSIKPQKGRNLITQGKRTLCKLYDTVVADIDMNKRTIVLNTGGYHTMSTAKAMNAAFEEAGIDFRVNAFRKRFLIHVCVDGQERIVNDEDGFTLSVQV